jgi:hypothetical protein
MACVLDAFDSVRIDEALHPIKSGVSRWQM